jgi:hypothetical protein
VDPDADPDEASAAPTEDIVLIEAQNILVDYANLLKGQPVVSQR